jgi:hypothetical protein
MPGEVEPGRTTASSSMQINPGILHAPGSLATYEPQINSDVFAIFQSEVEGRIVDWSLLVKDVKPEFSHDLDFLVSMLDWDANVNPEFAKSNKTKPQTAKAIEEMETEDYRELWITNGTPHYSAKELTVLPKRSVTIKDNAAYGAILTQGHGLIAERSISTPSMIRFGEMTEDEFFVTAAAAEEGVGIQNLSTSDPLVNAEALRPGNPDAQSLIRS